MQTSHTPATKTSQTNAAKPVVTRRGCNLDKAGLTAFELAVGPLTKDMLLMPVAECVSKLKSMKIKFEAAALDAVSKDQYRRAEELVKHAMDMREQGVFLATVDATLGQGCIAQVLALARLDGIGKSLAGHESDERDDALDWITSDALSGCGTGATFIGCCLAVGLEPSRARFNMLTKAGEDKLALQSDMTWDLDEIEDVQAAESKRAAERADAAVAAYTAASAKLRTPFTVAHQVDLF